MTRSHLALALVALCALVTSASRATSDEPPPPPNDMMKLMEKYAKPGKRHAELAAMVGSWDVVFTMPGMPGGPAKGTAETKWWLQGRFIETRIHLPKAMLGQDLELASVLGWDNFKNKWVGVGASSMGTDLVHVEGVVVDPTAKVRVLYGTLDEYMTGEHDKAIKHVTRMQGPDAYVLEIWDLAIGESGQVVLHFTFTRRK